MSTKYVIPTVKPGLTRSEAHGNQAVRAYVLDWFLYYAVIQFMVFNIKIELIQVLALISCFCDEILIQPKNNPGFDHIKINLRSR